MSKIDTALKVTIVTAMALMIASQKVIIDDYKLITRKNVLINKSLQRIIEKTIDELTPEQWNKIAPDLMVDIDFTDISLHNM